MKYVDGYVLPVPKKNLAAYRRMAQRRERFGWTMALCRFCECVGDDLKTKMAASFPATIQTQARRDGGFPGSSSSRARNATA